MAPSWELTVHRLPAPAEMEVSLRLYWNMSLMSETDPHTIRVVKEVELYTDNLCATFTYA